MRKLLVLIFLVVAGCSNKQEVKSFKTKDALIAQVIKAYDNEDINLFLQTIHPKCKTYINDEVKEFFEFKFKSLKTDIIKGKHMPSFKIHSINENISHNESEINNNFLMPIQPTVQVELRGDDGSKWILGLIKTDDNWYYTTRVPNEKIMNNFREIQKKIKNNL